MADTGHLHNQLDIALKRIDDECCTTNYEINGTNLDRILADFLRSIGCESLADKADNVDCWRA